MSHLFWCFSVFILYLWLHIYQCCPTGYTWCTDEGGACNLQGTNIIAYGANNLRWHYKKKIGSFSCNNDDGDPAYRTSKECCYANDIIYNVPSGISPGVDWSPGSLSCNSIQEGWLATETEAQIWQFITTHQLNSVRFDNCNSDAYDLQLYLYNSAG
eukprot:858379_1